MREIILDTETTGLDVTSGHRIIEIGAMEIVNLVPTGQTLHLYINPEREVDEDAVRIHGLTTEFLLDKPVFKDIAQEFLDFICDSPLVIHNAPFDIGFLNYELIAAGYERISEDKIIDTLPMARQRFPGASASLDALCRRFEVDNSHRDLHGALIDADLLAAVYIELKGGRQPGLLEEHQPQTTSHRKDHVISEVSQLLKLDIEAKNSPIKPIRPHHASNEEMQVHQQFIAKLTDPIWSQISEE